MQWGINSTINKSTGKIPNELLFGFLPTGKYGAYLSNEVLENTPTNLVFSRDQAKKSIDKMQEYQKRKFDQKEKKGSAYKKGQLVLVKKSRATEGCRKLLPKFCGPFQIVKYLGNDRYVIRDMPGSKRSRKPYEGIVSADKIKIYELFNAEAED